MTPLRRRMTEDMLIRNLSPCTQQSYLDQVTRFANHFQQPPERLGPEQIRDYQLFLATEKRLAPSSIGVAVSALRFLYGVTLGRDWEIREILPAPKQPSTLPVVPSPEEAVRFLDAVTPSGNRAVLTACYAAGLRVSEAVSLRPRDIDSARMVIRVEQGKGAKDRYTTLSQRLLEILRDYWRRTRPAGEWLFPGLLPGSHLSRHTVARACRKACERAGVSSRLCSTLPSDTASRRRPCASLGLHLHQVVQGTFTLKPPNMLGTQEKGGAVSRSPCLRCRACRPAPISSLR